jgi:hypothetical protein
MSQIFDELQQIPAGNATALFERVAAQLKSDKDYHKLFDSRLMQRKYELGLPVLKPASLADVPDELRKQVEETYIAAAREAGELFLKAGDIPAAWMYYQVIREPQPVKDAIEALPSTLDPNKVEEILQIALYQGVHPTKGIQMMLKAHGTCSTITAFDQATSNLSPAQRQDCAKVMVRSLYGDLLENLQGSVQKRMPFLQPGQSLRELMSGRDWLFEAGNYHIDVSHLNSVVRFARTIEPPAEELELALQLAEYGCKLDSQLQYGGEAPFDDFYPAHVKFFRVLLDKGRADALQYFQDRLDHEPDESDKPFLAYVLVDLMVRSNLLEPAVALAAKYLSNINSDARVSFAELCQKAGRFDVWKQACREQYDLLGYAAAVLGEGKPAAT